MLQTIDGQENVYVVDLDTMSVRPITWNTEKEKPYALALDDAIRLEKITEPGKYGIVITNYIPDTRLDYDIYTIIEK